LDGVVLVRRRYPAIESAPHQAAFVVSSVRLIRAAAMPYTSSRDQLISPFPLHRSHSLDRLEQYAHLRPQWKHSPSSDTSPFPSQSGHSRGSPIRVSANSKTPIARISSRSPNRNGFAASKYASACCGVGSGFNIDWLMLSEAYSGFDALTMPKKPATPKSLNELRNARLTAAQRSAIAKKAAAARWGKKK
jgi:hypothetical protein